MNPKEFRRELRKNQTGTEARLWSELRNRKLDGRKFRRQHSIGKYVVDFYCHEEKLVIEAHGKSHDNVGSMLYDEHRDAFLIKQGLKILRFTNDEIYHHLDEVLYHHLDEVLLEIKQNFIFDKNT